MQLKTPFTSDCHKKNFSIKVKSAVEDKVGKKLDTYTPVSYKTQVVAGTNYFVKVRIKAKNVL